MTDDEMMEAHRDWRSEMALTVEEDIVTFEKWLLSQCEDKKEELLTQLSIARMEVETLQMKMVDLVTQLKNEGTTWKEIAAVMNCSISAIKQRSFRRGVHTMYTVDPTIIPGLGY